MLKARRSKARAGGLLAALERSVHANLYCRQPLLIRSFTTSAPDKSSTRWFVCFLLFRGHDDQLHGSRRSSRFIEPLLHNVPFMGWNTLSDKFHQPVFDNNFGNVIICFQIAYGVGFLFAGRVIDRWAQRLGMR